MQMAILHKKYDHIHKKFGFWFALYKPTLASVHPNCKGEERTQLKLSQVSFKSLLYTKYKIPGNNKEMAINVI